MTTTGYSDTFGRTVAAGLGVATSGQTYSTFGTPSQFSVAPNTASIAVATLGDKYGYIDFETQNLDITAQVAIGAIPASNLATVGFVSKLSNTTNYYNGTMMVATGGAISLRFSKVVAGGISTISTTATGLTYVANTFYNLRYQIYWSRALQTNVMSLKLWAVGATEPGGWMATSTDAAFTDYTAGTSVGIMGRDESSVLGTIVTKHRSVLARSYNLPMPALTDPMCADPAITYPKQTALQSLAVAADAAMAAIDPLTSLAGLFPRVRVSNSNFKIATATFPPLTFGATEFNVGTPTDLGYNNKVLSLPVGIWLVTFEIQLVEAASDYFQIELFGGNPGPIDIDVRSNAVQANDQGVGGTGHGSFMTTSTDPTTPVQVQAIMVPNNTNTTYTVTYMALSAIKISDYFT